jgi:hypothetical protein
LKELLMAIHTKISPPVDSDKKADFYEKFCDEYCSQNQHRNVTPENVYFMFSCTFFVMTQSKHKMKTQGISFEQYLEYADLNGDDFITVSQAKTYYSEIIEDRFIKDFSIIEANVDGIRKFENNMNYMRNAYKMAPKVTSGDPFYTERCPVYKLQLNQSKITEKEISINEDSKTF